jgi:hypothetical protein
MGRSKLFASLDSAIQLEAKSNIERKSSSPDPVQSPTTEYPLAPDDCEEAQVSLGKQAKTLSKRQIGFTRKDQISSQESRHPPAFRESWSQG